jgi:hypothetical protein
VRIPLVAGQPLTGLQRVLLAADSANGVSGRLPFAEWLFLPTALTVTLQRHSGRQARWRSRTIASHAEAIAAYVAIVHQRNCRRAPPARAPIGGGPQRK